MAAKYQIIAEDLRQKIEKGIYSSGQTLPTEARLREIYQVSRYTVRQALALLGTEGILRTERGSGTFVQERKAVAGGRIKTIGVMLNSLSDYIFPAILRGIEQTLREKGFALLLASSDNDFEQERVCLDKFLEQGVDGLIAEPARSNCYNPNLDRYVALKAKGIPIIFINANYELLDIPYVGLDDVRAGFDATAYLLAKGYQDVGIAVNMDMLQGKRRLYGFIQAYEKAGYVFDENNLFPFTEKSRMEVIQKIVRRAKENKDSRLTGLICYNDEFGESLLKELNAAGISVPGELALVSIDHLDRAGRQPVLTSVDHPKERLGEKTAQLLLEAVAGQKAPQTYLFRGNLIEGNSA